ncbi:hypothetical protein TRFO_38180 [Tritrichomonas foetus]|uniref:Leucine Rich Repeat family protein n=1 Tax=Tritrichomonas foetus TaxID=1144522 RepID=A0A1J4J911_9EUKA|nr:hypothetical protein TRFO_38180 [Tritrichomonas foetus]|eukprot:OHS95674.1 hypothetical protein TRFO_38180 [Tritrichomonas foetus]
MKTASINEESRLSLSRQATTGFSRSKLFKITNEAAITFDRNIDIPMLNEERKQMRFTKDHKFDFNNLYPSLHTLLLLPTQIPLNQNEEQDVSIEKAKATRGKFKDQALYESMENRRKIQSKIGSFEPPEHFFMNSSDHIPKLHSNKRVSTLESLEQNEGNDEIIMIALENIPIHHQITKTIFNTIKTYNKIEILSLKGTGINHLPDFMIPNLRILDICDNNIDDGAKMAVFVKNHKSLAILDYRRNPIAETEAVRRYIIENSCNLRYINGRLISVRDRIQAIQTTNDKFKKSEASKWHFFYQVKAIPEISSLKNWDLRMIQHLSLPNCGLTTFCIHKFKNLVSLNLSDNNIKELKGTGLVCCKKLTSIDLRNNEIDSHDQLSCFPFVYSLLHIWLTGNKIHHYRKSLIYNCRNLLGTTAMSGLQTIDGIPITISEFLDSDPQIQGVDKLTWKLNVKRIIGNSDLKNAFSLSFAYRGLKYINLSQFTSLTHLSLRGNNFSEIKGLECCINLIVLDISHNPKMNLSMVLEQITKLKNLEYLMTADDCWKNNFEEIDQYNDIFDDKAPNRSICNLKYRQKILGALVPNLPYLSSVDRIRISVPERCLVLKKCNMSKVEIENYRAQVAWIQAAFPTMKIDFTPDKVLPGIQYKPVEVTSMKRTRGCELLSNEIFNLSIFKNLTELDLSYNKLTTITTLGLEGHPNLRYLDLSYNNIEDSIDVLANFIDGIPNLEAIALRINPIMKTTTDRKNLISKIKRLQKMDDCLRFIDYEIDPTEIVDKSEPDKIPLLALKIRTPQTSQFKKIEELSLDNCSLKSIDLSKFPSLKKLYLANNNISQANDISGLGKKLSLLDLQNNRFKNIAEIVKIILLCPSLKNIGLSGNPCIVKDRDYRIKILSLISPITDPFYKLKAIDDTIILPSEIAKATKSREIKARFAFIHAIDINFKNTSVLDLSNSELTTFLDFHQFPSLKILKLKNNKITLESIINSNLNLCIDLEELDLSNNSIRSSEGFSSLGTYLSQFTKLTKLDVSYNPMCTKPRLWKSFAITFPGLAEVSCPLKYINMYKLTVDDRVSVVKEQTRSEDQAAGFRCSFLLYQISPDYVNLHSISLSGLSITIISPISNLTHLQSLDLSNNNIKKLSGQGLERLKSLRTLNICDNQIESIDEIRDTLSILPSLERLFMLRSTAQKEETDDQKDYMSYMCHILRGLIEIDKYQNPTPLKTSQLNALKDLEQVANWNNPNHIHDIDIRGKNVTQKEFQTVIRSLETLGTLTVDLRNNPCNSVDNYRFHLIYGVHSLTQIDGEPVTVNQRMNADKSVRHHVGESAAANVAIGGAVVAAEFLDVEKREQTTSLIQKAADFACQYGSLLMKWEIFITCQQIFAQISGFFEKEVWPRIYRYFSWTIFIFAIDLSFLDFLLDIRIPFWFSYASFFIYIILPALFFGFYHMSLDKDYWFSTFTTNWDHTVFLSIFALFMLFLCSAGLALLADFNYTIHTLEFTNNQLAWFCVLSFISLIAFIVFMVCAHIFRKNSKDPVVWFRVLKFKKRLALFFMTVLYFPIVKAFISTFSCTNGHARNFDDVVCLDIYNFKTIQVVHIAAFIFGIVYGIGIPIFFVRLINKGVKEIDLNYHIDIKLKRLEEKKKEVKKMKKQGKDVSQLEEQLKNTKKDIDKRYSEAAFQYENAAAYLYNAYDRDGRYKKVVSMIEKLVYLLVTTFVPVLWLECTVNTVVMLLMTLLQIFTSPFVAPSENIMETVAKSCNLLTLAVGDVLQFNQKKMDIFEKYVAPALLILFASAILILFIFLIVKIHMCKSCKSEEKDDDKIEKINLNTLAGVTPEPNSLIVQSTSVPDNIDEPEMYSTLKSLNVGDGTLRRGQMIDGGGKNIKYEFSDHEHDSLYTFEGRSLEGVASKDSAICSQTQIQQQSEPQLLKEEELSSSINPTNFTGDSIIKPIYDSSDGIDQNDILNQNLEPSAL